MFISSAEDIKLKITPIHQYLKLPGKLIKADVGIEVEVEMKKYNVYLHDLDSDDDRRLNEWWTFKPDYSLKKNGVEFVSRPLYSDEVTTALQTLDDSIQLETTYSYEELFYNSVRASTHIHINMQEYTMLDFFKLLAVYYPLENLLLKYCGDSREGNLFCLRFCDVDNIQSALINYIKSGSLGNLFTDALRYSAFNFQSLFKFGTVEFRTLRTPQDLSTIAEWVDILLAFRSKATSITSFTDIPYKISGMGAEYWAREMLGNDFVDKYKYPNMDRDIIKNMRQMQIIYHKFQGLL